MNEHELLDSYRNLEEMQGKIVRREVEVAEGYSAIYKAALKERAMNTAEITRASLISSRDKLNAYVVATSRTNDGIKLRFVGETVSSIDTLLRETEKDLKNKQ